MRAIFTLGMNTFRRSLRARSLWLVFFFAIALLLFMSLASRGDEEIRNRMMLDSGLSLMKMFGLILVIFNTLPMFPGEKEFRTLHAMLAMDVSRHQIVLGIFSGIVLALVVNFSLMIVVFLGCNWGMGLSVPIGAGRTMLLLFQELCVLSSFALLFSISMGFLMSLMSCLFVYLLGNLTSSIHFAMEESSGVVMRWIIKALYLVLPNFSLFNLKDATISGQPIPIAYDLFSGLYSISYIVIVLLVSIWLFERQEIT
jgi:Cu-processing system permease protein